MLLLNAAWSCQETHVRLTSSCAFGTDGLLYITSARNGLSATELARQPLSGSVFTVETDTAGVDVSPFRA